jgi:large-conductance mechanosensitive channel
MASRHEILDENTQDTVSRTGLFAFLCESYALDIAIGILLATGLLNIVNAFMRDLVAPLVKLFVVLPPLEVALNRSTFLIGDFLNALIFFVFFILVVSFLIIVPICALRTRVSRDIDFPRQRRQK